MQEHKARGHSVVWAYTRHIPGKFWHPRKRAHYAQYAEYGGGNSDAGKGCISFRRQPATNGGSLPVRTCHHDEVWGAAPEDGSLIRKIRDGRGLDAIHTSLPLEGAPAGSLARGS